MVMDFFWRKFHALEVRWGDSSGEGLSLTSAALTAWWLFGWLDGWMEGDCSLNHLQLVLNVFEVAAKVKSCS